MAAILRRAVYDFVLYKDPEHAKHSLALDAAEWIFWDGVEEENEDGQWTFRYICDHLGIKYKYVRKRLHTLTKDDIKRLSHHLKETRR